MAKINYDEQKRSKAGSAALLRSAVACYLIYLGCQIAAAKDTSMSLLTARLIGGGMIAAACLFGVYIWKRWRIDLAEAVLPAEILKQDKEQDAE